MPSFSDVLYIISVMFIVLTFFSFFNEKVIKLPNEIGLMAIAFIVSLTLIITDRIGVTDFNAIFIQIQNVDFNDLVMNGFLVFLLFSGSAKIRITDLTHDKFLILTLAIFSTIFATFVYAVLFYFLSNLMGLHFTFLESSIVGAIIAPTDPISAMSILQKAGISKRLSLIMEGESLFNDGVGVALFVTLVAINSSSEVNPIRTFFSIVSTGLIGAGLLGFIIAFVMFLVFKNTHQKQTEVMASLAAVTTAYALSEHFGVSAPIAAVVVGIIFASNMYKLHDDYETYYSRFYGFWEVIDRILNGFLFIMIGLIILFLYDSESAFILSIISIPIALFARLVSVTIPIYFFSRNSDIKPEQYIKDMRRKDKLSMTKLLTWGGLKGGISIALAMGTRGIFSIEQYYYVIAGTYSVVAFSILVQGLTIRHVYMKLEKDLH